MSIVTINVDQTLEVLAELAKNIRHLAQDQRYHNDEDCMITCADIMDRIVLELTPHKDMGIIGTDENCPICGMPSDDGPHEACIDKLVDDEPEPGEE